METANCNNCLLPTSRLYYWVPEHNAFTGC